MKLKLGLVARDVIVAQDSGVPSAINILEGIQGGGFPLFIQGLAFLTVWQRENGDPDEHVGNLIVRLDNTELVRQQVRFAFQGRPLARNVAQIAGLLIPQPGILEFREEYGEQSASYQVSVQALPSAEVQVHSLPGQSSVVPPAPAAEPTLER